MANEQLGEMPCGCGGVKRVYQAKRSGAHLYTRCDDCGLDQRSGARVQQKIWDSTTWFDGAPTPPTCIDPARRPTKPTENRPNKPANSDFDPTEQATEQATKQQPKKQPKGSGGGVSRFIGGALVLGALGLMIARA